MRLSTYVSIPQSFIRGRITVTAQQVFLFLFLFLPFVVMKAEKNLLSGYEYLPP